MKKYDTVTLVSESPQAHGMFDPPSTTLRTLYCEIDSVGMNETYQAMSNGLEAQYTIKLALSEDYHNEKIAIYKDNNYRVIRSASLPNGGLKLILGEITTDREVVSS